MACPSPWLNVSAPMKNRPNISAFSPALAQSNRRPERSECGSARIASNTLNTPNGTLTANSHSQVATDRMAEARLGPSAAAADTTNAFSPTPRPSKAWG